MSCCRERRGSFTERHRLKVRYGGGRSIIVRGASTGNEYRFSGIARVGLVDPRDAVAMVRNALFRVIGVVELPQHESSPVGKEVRRDG